MLFEEEDDVVLDKIEEARGWIEKVSLEVVEGSVGKEADVIDNNKQLVVEKVIFC